MDLTPFGMMKAPEWMIDIAIAETLGGEIP